MCVYVLVGGIRKGQTQDFELKVEDIKKGKVFLVFVQTFLIANVFPVKVLLFDNFYMKKI